MYIHTLLTAKYIINANVDKIQRNTDFLVVRLKYNFLLKPRFFWENVDYRSEAGNIS